MPKPIFETLKLLRGGVYLEECSDALAEAVRAVDETGKAGKVTLTLSLTKTNGAIAVLAVLAEVTNKAPKTPPDADLLWPTVEGNLSLSNPNQRSLDLQVAERGPREVKHVDASTGEIQRAS